MLIDKHWELFNIWVVVFYEVLVIYDIIRQMECFYTFQSREYFKDRVNYAKVLFIKSKIWEVYFFRLEKVISKVCNEFDYLLLNLRTYGLQQLTGPLINYIQAPIP